jgi:hypothetical protein
MIKDAIAEEAKDLNIMNFKLTNGDDVVALVARNNVSEGYIVVEGGLLLNKYLDDRTNSYTYAFEEWSPLAEDHVTMINRVNIVSQSTVSEHTKANYLRTIIKLYAESALERTEEVLDWPDDDDTDTTVH